MAQQIHQEPFLKSKMLLRTNKRYKLSKIETLTTIYITSLREQVSEYEPITKRVTTNYASSHTCLLTAAEKVYQTRQTISFAIKSTDPQL